MEWSALKYLDHKLAETAAATTISDESWYGRGRNIRGCHVLHCGRNFWCSSEKTAKESTAERESQLQKLVILVVRTIAGELRDWRVATGVFSTISCRNYQFRRLVIHATAVGKNWNYLFSISVLRQSPPWTACDGYTREDYCNFFNQSLYPAHGELRAGCEQQQYKDQ